MINSAKLFVMCVLVVLCSVTGFVVHSSFKFKEEFAPERVNIVRSVAALQALAAKQFAAEKTSLDAIKNPEVTVYNKDMLNLSKKYAHEYLMSIDAQTRLAKITEDRTALIKTLNSVPAPATKTKGKSVAKLVTNPNSKIVEMLTTDSKEYEAVRLKIIESIKKYNEKIGEPPYCLLHNLTGWNKIPLYPI